ncbi:hypothetical protein [Photobacterium atrarenae]|nr:hypothetical protein [Photobacterium atrarenae]
MMLDFEPKDVDLAEENGWDDYQEDIDLDVEDWLDNEDLNDVE